MQCVCSQPGESQQPREAGIEQPTIVGQQPSVAAHVRHLHDVSTQTANDSTLPSTIPPKTTEDASTQTMAIMVIAHSAEEPCKELQSKLQTFPSAKFGFPLLILLMLGINMWVHLRPDEIILVASLLMPLLSLAGEPRSLAPYETHAPNICRGHKCGGSPG